MSVFIPSMIVVRRAAGLNSNGPRGAIGVDCCGLLVLRLFFGTPISARQETSDSSVCGSFCTCLLRRGSVGATIVAFVEILGWWN